MDKLIEITTAQMAVGKGAVRLRTSSIGSCLVVVLYDYEAKVGGMAHAMLPSRPSHENVADVISMEAPAKYVDEAIDLLIYEIEKSGGKKERLKAKLVGGAKMFKVLGSPGTGIGESNLESARKHLERLGIEIESEEVGGSIGRIAEVNLQNGLVTVTTKM